jgi:hypothetical protein
MSGSDSDSGDEKTSSLSDATYGGWKSRMLSRLDRKRVGVFVDGTKPCPTPRSGPATDAASVAAAEKAEEKIVDWKIKDREAKGIIAGQLPHDHLHMVDAAPTSKALWDSIVLKYEGNRSAASVAATLVDVINKRWQDGSLEKHISWYRATNQLLAKFDPGTSPTGPTPTGAAIPEHILSILLINSIPSVDEWGAVKAVIFASAVFRFEEVAAKLMGESHRLKLDGKEKRGAGAAAHYSRGQSSPSPSKGTAKGAAPATGEWEVVTTQRTSSTFYPRR